LPPERHEATLATFPTSVPVPVLYSVVSDAVPFFKGGELR